MRQNTRFDFKSIRLSLSKSLHLYRMDVLLALILAIATGIMCFLMAQAIPTPLLTDFYAQDVWFGSDLPTVFGNITSFKSDFGRNNKHPLFPILIFPLVFGASKLLHLDPVTATRLVLALTAAVWMAGLYSLFRLMGCPRLDAILFSLVGGVSAATIFWFVVPDSFPFASVTILLGLVFVLLTQMRSFSPAWYIAVGVLTVSITITNWMVGLLAAIVNHRWKKTLQIIALTLLVVTAIWFVQRVIFPNSGFPFQPKTFIGEKKFMTGPSATSVLSALGSFAYQTIVMPAIQLSESALRPEWVKPEVNTLAPGSGGVWGMVAAIAWTGLLLLGTWGFFTTKRHSKLRIVLGFTIIGQLLIHSVYGTGETFLYALHFAPLLLTLMAFVSLTRFRLLGLALAGVLIVSAGINNRSQFNDYTAALLDYGTPRQQVQAQIGLRPGDLWSRSAGHVVLAAAGSPAESKSYHEPGGSFSPEAGSFGVSIWMVDQTGNPKTTSDTIPLNQIQQQLTNTPGQVPGVLTKTEFYQAAWASPKPGTWQLTMNPATTVNTQPVIVIRSTGPAGGAVRSLQWNGQRLLINDRWVIQDLPAAAKVYLGSERSPGWMRQKATATQWQDDKGWGYARIELGQGRNWNLNIVDQSPPPTVAETVKTTTNPVLNLPDRQFVDSLNAQVAHLTMGVVGNQTRPGDPIDYPLPRFRDGAYELVALTRTGNLELAQQLVPYFAATDFLNGTQPEAEIPALGIWALTAVANQVNQPEFDQSIWADVRRKAGLIIDLQASHRPGYPIVDKSRLPFAEHPDFMEQELLAGKMDATPGLIALDATTNLMSYRALLDAAALADRVKQATLATHWRSQATELQTAWQQTFDRTFAGMDITYTSGLWPSGIATINPDQLKPGLESRWQAAYDNQGNLRQIPENTNFKLAEAHQWLLLNQPERVWTTLRWYWQNQASPGLYTWWGKNDDPKGTRIPGSFSQWHRYRGWVNPPHFTPHYWTAAEMLLLQLDMLAYVDPTANQPTLVVGAGIPKEWLNQPMSVKGLGIDGKQVNWVWDGKQVSVQIQGQKMNVRLGKSFPETASVNVGLLPQQA